MTSTDNDDITMAQIALVDATEIANSLKRRILISEDELLLLIPDMKDKHKLASKLKMTYDSNVFDLEIYNTKKISHKSNIISLTDEIEKTNEKITQIKSLSNELGISSVNTEAKAILENLSNKLEFENKAFTNVDTVITHTKIETENLLDKYMTAQFSSLELTGALSKKQTEIESTKTLYDEQLNNIHLQTNLLNKLMIKSRISKLSEILDRDLTTKQNDHICELFDTFINQVSPPLNLL